MRAEILGVPVGAYVPSTGVGAPIVNVQSYGAVGDGVTDDTAAIQAALAVAQTAIGGGIPGAVLYFPPGIWTIYTADTFGNALTITNPGTQIRGAGKALSYIRCKGSFTWLTQLYGFDSGAITDISVQASSGSYTYGIGASCASTGHSGGHSFTNVRLLDEIGTTGSAFALGPDNPGSAAMDIAGCHLLNCEVLGHTTGTPTAVGLTVGNQTEGNVVQNTATNFSVDSCTDPIHLQGAGLRMFGGGFSGNSGTDIKLIGASAYDQYLFVGVRGDSGQIALDTTGCTDGGPSTGVHLIDHHITGYGTAQVINWTVSTKLELDGGRYQTTGGSTTFYVVGGSAATPATFIATGIETDNVNAFPAAGALVKRFYTGNTYTVSGTSRPNPNAFFVNDSPAHVVQGETQPFTGELASSMPRWAVGSVTVPAVTSGQVRFSEVYLQAGDVVGHLGYCVGSTSAITPTHQWLALCDSGLNMLAVTADQMSAAISADTTYSYAVATVGAGAATSYTVLTSGIYFVAHLVVAGTMPTYAGVNNGLSNMIALGGTTKELVSTATTFSTPPVFPEAFATSATSQTPYFYVAT